MAAGIPMPKVPGITKIMTTEVRNSTENKDNSGNKHVESSKSNSRNGDDDTDTLDIYTNDYRLSNSNKKEKR